MSVQAMAWVLEQERTTTGTDRLVLLSLANHVSQEAIDGPWECWPGIDLIAREANVTRRQTVKDALGRLKAKGLVSVLVNGAPDRRIPADRRPNLYTIHHDGGTAAVSPDGGTADDGRGHGSRSDGGSGDRATGAREASPKPALDPVEEPAVDPVALFDADQPQPPTIAAAAMFTRFWEAYPSERRTAKGDARKAWAAAIGRAEPEAIIAGAVRYAEETRTWAPGEFARWGKTPGPWLRADMWEDEPGLHVRNGGRPAAGPRGPIGQHLGPAGRVTEL